MSKDVHEDHHEDEIEKLEDEIERLREALEDIAKWCAAYPVAVFTELTSDDWEVVHQALAGTVLVDRMHASWARRLVEGVGKIAREALDAEV